MSVETTGPIVELSFRWNPRDRDEIAEMGDHIARITGALAQAGVTHTIKSPSPAPMPVPDASVAQAEPLAPVKRKTRATAPPQPELPAEPEPEPEPDPIVDDLVYTPADEAEYTPKEQLEASFVVLREAYQRPDGVPAVKALQKSMKVSKFSDVPLSRAGELFTACRGIAEKLNLRVPPPG
jgi:hypothetical protein